MDTIQLRFKSTKYKSEDIVKRMILHQAKRTQYHPIKGGQYFSNEFRTQVYIKDKNLFLYLQCDSHKEKDVLEITWHQSQVGSLNNLIEKLEHIFGHEFTADLITKAFIKRLDICVDTKIPFDTLKTGLLRKRVKISSVTFSSKGRTYTVGGARSNQIIVYEKLVHGILVTRIEFRFKKKIPISHLSQCRELLLFDWDSEMKIFQWDISEIKLSNSTLVKSIYKQSLRNNLIQSLYRYRKAGRFKNEILPCLSIYAQNLNWGEQVKAELENKYLVGFPAKNTKGDFHGCT